MKMGRLAVTGVALVTLAGLSACGEKKEPALTNGAAVNSAAATAETTAAAAPGDASAELVAAAQKLTSSSGKIHLTSVGGIVADGAFDASNKLMSLKMDMSSLGTVDMRQVSNDLYIKYGGPAAKNFANGKWMHIDASKMPSSSPLSLEKNDPRNSAKMIEAAASDVKKTGDGTFSGTIDITKSPSSSEQLLKALEGKSKQIPFTAEVNSDGYLTKMALDMDSIQAGAGETVANYSGMGTKVSVSAPPTSQTVEMPKSAIAMMGG
ncbi:hypothetical protein [Actinoplanes awajinensis]|uniref:LppX_LprAFG lipoprotein n=1 Tax=Actinoplanes awajinensis subsp. mycoplanecinus TaxID=135947 RepID=A0A0X3UTY9_9ACTN|nr:hypothetical protein [Actinoplanes awajinensis]KUL35272.1 hypothetical protein ADL15_14730 [Actinoplanes awajinensis subsp. mycoplanecinus]